MPCHSSVIFVVQSPRLRFSMHHVVLGAGMEELTTSSAVREFRRSSLYEKNRQYSGSRQMKQDMRGVEKSSRPARKAGR